MRGMGMHSYSKIENAKDAFIGAFIVFFCF